MDKRQILLVEDNSDDELLTIMALKQNNIVNEIVVAKDGEMALEYLFNIDKKENNPLKTLPSLVLLDLKLPKISGLEVLKEIRENEKTRNLLVVILTTSAEESDIFESYKYHVNSYIRKPVNFDQFAQVVKNIGMYWLLLNQPPIK